MTPDEKSEAWETLMKKASEVREVPLDSIRIDPRFQRALSEPRVQKIVDEYHDQGIGIVVLAHLYDTPTDEYVCVDGQTRIQALWRLRKMVTDGEEVSRPVPDTVTAEVYDSLTVEQAATLFQLRNFQALVPVAERNRIGVTAGDPLLTEILHQVNLAGFTMLKENGSAPTMPYIDAGKQIVRWGKKYDRPELLAEALTVQANAFGKDYGAVNKIVLQATASLLRKNPDLDEDKFTELLRDLSTPKIIAQAENIRAEEGVRQVKAVEKYLVREYSKMRGVKEKIRT